MPLLNNTCITVPTGMIVMATATSSTINSIYFSSQTVATATSSVTQPWGLGQGLQGQISPWQALGHTQSIAETQESIRRREQQAYQKALEEHNEQEVARIKQLIDARELAEEDRRRRHAERELQIKEEAERAKVAQQRANDLLLAHLTPEQQKTFLDKGWFVIEGGESKTKYRIRSDTRLVANIDVFDKAGEKVVHRLCAHPPVSACPLGDHLLAQKMILEIDEEAFLRVANVHR